MYLYPSYGNQYHNDQQLPSPQEQYRRLRKWNAPGGLTGGEPSLRYFSEPGRGAPDQPAPSMGSHAPPPQQQYGGWNQPTSMMDMGGPPPQGLGYVQPQQFKKRRQLTYGNIIQRPLPYLGY